jgi:proline dehydrogenase
MSKTVVPVSFDNTENAFAYKSDKELKKAHFLFSSMGYQALVQLVQDLLPGPLRLAFP